jgi:hypothetical protein
MNKKTFFAPILTKVVPEDFEAWMEGLALEGWNIDKLPAVGIAWMTFHKTEPKRYRYVYDLNIPALIKRKDYKQTYEQFGWEFVGALNANTFLWRKEYTDERPESFTDRESLQTRNKRVRNVMLAVLVWFIVAFAALLTGIVVCAIFGKLVKILPLAFAAGFVAAMDVYFWCVLRKLNASLDR